MSIQPLDLPPKDPILFDAHRDWALVGVAVGPRSIPPAWVLVTINDETERRLCPAVIEGDTTVQVTMRLLTSNLPPRERVTIAILAGAVLDLDDDGLHWMWRGLDGVTTDRIEPEGGFLWEPETVHKLELTGVMRSDNTGSLELWIDGLPAGNVTACPTWSLDNPRAWVAGPLNVRPENGAGSFAVELRDLHIRETDRVIKALV